MKSFVFNAETEWSADLVKAGVIAPSRSRVLASRTLVHVSLMLTTAVPYSRR